MSQERWDVKLQFLSGPLRFQDLPPARGPVVQLGANRAPAVSDSQDTAASTIGGR